jgi:hypothetical protein
MGNTAAIVVKQCALIALSMRGTAEVENGNCTASRISQRH